METNKNENVTISTAPFAIEISANAWDTLDAVGLANPESVQLDIDAIVNGKTTAEALLAECLDGAVGDDVIAGWGEYVDAVEAAAAR